MEFFLSRMHDVFSFLISLNWFRYNIGEMIYYNKGLQICVTGMSSGSL